MTSNELNYLLQANSLNECISILRYKFKDLNQYYTEISPASDTLISLNPFKQIPDLFSPQIMSQYNKHDLKTPHIFKYATNALDSVLSHLDPVNQTILVTGESGSGKTSAINYLMAYFTHVTHRSFLTDDSNRLESLLLYTNPILEAFGNASTIQNENSSRFGKYIELRFNYINKNVHLSSVKLITYLLEKTRATRMAIDCNERNFHIFYQMISGANESERLEWLLTNELIACFKVNHLNDLTNWNLVKESFKHLNITNYSDIFRLISCICHLNISNPDLKSVAVLLGFNSPDQLDTYLSFQELNITSISVKRLCTTAETIVRKDALTKFIYVQLFKWLVNALNERLTIHRETNNINKFIGLLDIYGFENLNINSLEQLCINYANEKLHQIFVDSHLKSVQQECLNELIEWVPIDCDNTEILDQLESFQKKSLFSILNEECMLRRDLSSRRGSEQATANLLTKILTANHRFINETKPFKSSTFIVKHYAGDVDYRVDEFIQKNKDQIPDDLIRFLTKTNNKFLTLIIKNKNEIRKKTVIDKFKLNLNVLVAKLKEARIYYVRCIRPNQLKQSDKFDSNMVKNQLEACGLNALLELSRRFSFRHRLEYSKFCSKYNPLLKRKHLDLKQSAESIVKQTNHRDSFRLGKTKIFLNDTLTDCLNKQLECVYFKSATKIQAMWRMCMARNDYKLKLRSVKRLQQWFRQISARNSLISSSSIIMSTSSTITLMSCSSDVSLD